MKTTQPRIFLPTWAACLAGILAWGIASTGHAQAFKKKPEKLDEKIIKCGAYFDILQANTKTRIPPVVLQNAKGIIILRQVKAGLGIGIQAGGGVALVRDAITGAWSAPAFIKNVEGSYGFQIGGQKTDTVFLLMDDRGMKVLRDGGLKFGVNLRATAGPVSGGGEVKADTIKEPVLIYSDSGGLYAGAALEGGGIGPSDKANAVYYGKPMREILFSERRTAPTATGRQLIEKLNRYSAGR